MKKAILILVIGLFWCSVGFAEDKFENQDIFAPWNDTLMKDDIFAPWNDILSGPEDTNQYLREQGVSDTDYYWK